MRTIYYEQTIESSTDQEHTDTVNEVNTWLLTNTGSFTNDTVNKKCVIKFPSVNV